MNTMTKADLIRQIADQTRLTQKEVGKVLDELGATLSSAAEGGVTVNAGFGRFVPKARAARTGRNPQTGEPVAIAAKTTVSFRQAKPKS